ncbi:MAG TPA: TfoX/Sxy family protein [Acidimicrobiia bacterium]|jgi:TfoX/Sxy family transcriptional regulator of competence genes
MKMPKTSDADKELFRALLPDQPGVTQRPMFGQLAGFVNGNMFLCLFGDRIAVKLSESEEKELLKVKGAEPFVPMEGRPMRGYVFLPKSWHKSPHKAEKWVARSLAYVGSLPAKAKSAKAVKKK